MDNRLDLTAGVCHGRCDCQTVSAPPYKYSKPPIQEVVCELHFASEDSLSISEIEKLKEFWAEEYPNQNLSEEKNVHFRVEPGGMHIDETKVGQRLICKSKDGTRLVQLSGRFLAVNQLKPYPGWEEAFRDAILARAKELISAIRSLSFRQVGLRYINKIEVPETPLVWENWFQFSMPFPKIAGSALDVFQMHFEQKLPESCRLIVNSLSPAPTAEGRSAVILDLDVVWQGGPVEYAKISEILERVHAPHRLAFESYITDKLRKVFS